MKTYLAKSDAEAKGLHEGLVTEIAIPIHPQPYTPDVLPHSWQWEKPTGGRVTWNKRNPGYPQRLDDASPFQAGDRIAVREDWAESDTAGVPTLETRYAADYHCGERDNRYVWIPGEVMWDDDIRTHLLCESVEARQVDGTWCFVCRVKKENP